MARLTQLGVADVVQGPFTDNLDNTYRRPQVFNQAGQPIGDEPVHFNTAGSSIVASRWVPIIKNHINSSVAPVTPQSIGTEPHLLTVQSDGTVSAPAGFSDYRWVVSSDLLDAYAPVAATREVIQGNVSSPQVVNGKTILPAGEYRAFIKNGQGNFILTQSLELPTTDPGTPPTSGQTCKNGNENSGGNRTPNGATVGGFGNSSEFMEYSFNVPTAGSTNFSIHYASGDSQADIMLVVNGTSVPLYRPGTASWMPNADATTTITLIAGNNTIRLQGSGDGNFTYDRLCIGSGSTPPPACFSIAPTVSNANPGCNAPLTLNANCSGNDCGGVSLAWSGNGQTYSGPSPGITGPGSNGTTTYSVTASKAGCSNQTGSVSINVSGCVTTGLAITGAAFNCGNGVVTLTMTGLNGNPVEYQAPGLQAWSTNPLVIPIWQRNNTTFTLYARQSGNNEASIGYTSSCAGYRMATSTEETAEGLWVSPNPTSGNVVARFTLNEGQGATLSVVNLTGQSLHSRAVVGTGKAQDETLDLSQQASGLYVVRLQTAVGVKTAKVILQR